MPYSGCSALCGVNCNFLKKKLITQMLIVLVVSLCKPVIHNLKFFWGKLEYYKSMGGTTKKGESNFESSVEGSKGW